MMVMMLELALSSLSTSPILTVFLCSFPPSHLRVTQFASTLQIISPSPMKCSRHHRNHVPVYEGVVQQEYGVVGRALHRGHGAVHEHVQGVVHGALACDGHTRLWTGKTCGTDKK